MTLASAFRDLLLQKTCDDTTANFKLVNNLFEYSSDISLIDEEQLFD
jgi:hypothetical protein